VWHSHAIAAAMTSRRWLSKQQQHKRRQRESRQRRKAAKIACEGVSCGKGRNGGILLLPDNPLSTYEATPASEADAIRSSADEEEDQYNNSRV
jgi:hypothetical protein